MANSKSKKTTAKKKSSNKPKNTSAEKTEKIEKSEVRAENIKDNKEAKEEKTEKVTTVEETTVVEVVEVAEKNPFKGFFARKGDPEENILTIFKSPRIYGALIGEVIGTMLLAMLLLTLGVYQPLYIMFGIIAITAAVYAISGAHLNPIVTAGMMATRRVSAIRGVLYIIAQVVGAWLGFILVNAFVSSMGEDAAALQKMAEVADGKFWTVTCIELLGAVIIGFFFARALSYKRSALTFAAVVGTGVAFAILLAVVLSSNYLGLQNNFVLNPAVAIMYQILPVSGDGFGSLFGSIMLALATYVVIPMVGGIVGFFIADISSRLSGEKVCCGHCHDHVHSEK